MKTSAPLFAAAIALVTPAAFAAERPEDRWNLEDVYATPEAWSADSARLESQLKDFQACKGHLGDSARRLRECLDLQADIAKRYARLDLYANEKFAEDTGKPVSLERRQGSRVLATKMDEATSFLRPELLRVGKAKVDAYLRQEKGLAIYRHPLDDILRMAPHTLDSQGESILATLGLAEGSAGSAYEILASADMPWPTVKLSDGREVKVDQSAYTELRELPNREDRRKVFEAYWGRWKEFERTFGVTLYESFKEDGAWSRVRKYPDSFTRALDANRVPPAVYDTLIKEARANLPTLHRYFRLRARMLGIPPGEMNYYDIYPPLVKSDRRYSVDEAKRMTLEAVKPLGEAYVSAMDKGFSHRWMDAYPRPHKNPGAHMAGSAYDVHPYVLMNFTDNYESVTTLAHEWGHAMHSYLSNATQPFVTSDYAIFVAEIASTMNEDLLLESALREAKSDEERLFYLGSALEGLRATFFRQAMFAEFEREAHARVDKGESLTGEAFTKLYGGILDRYHGVAEGVMKIDPLYDVEWAYIPHFYGAFYVYQYATSIAASSLFADAVLKGEPGARERYLKMLSSGSSDYPYELVKAAGVDLATPAPYRSLVARMNRIMDEIEAILARRK
jgi:oligoendopeptidase F